MIYFEVPSHIKGLIFDIDGTLVDTMPIHYKACRVACQKYGFDFPLDYFLAKAGRPTLTVFEEYVQEYGIDRDGRALGVEKELILESLIPEFKPMPVIAETAKKYFGKLKMALGTGGTDYIATKTLEAADMNKYFNILISADDVTNYKPHPETFLKAAEAMGLKPSECLVFEDAEPGIKAAIDGGFEVLDIRTVTPEPIYEVD
ncbi:HAD-IA family hydrolase [Cyclobacteriaceae bacterium]|nr:HAD-IA family hydrolase [Cyclobacteriaceae bacterium]